MIEYAGEAATYKPPVGQSDPWHGASVYLADMRFGNFRRISADAHR